MGPVRIYTRQGCEFSREAKELLDDKGIEYEEVDVTGDPGLLDEMVRLSGRHSTPQVFIGDRHVGGASDLLALDRRGELDELLGRTLGQFEP